MYIFELKTELLLCMYKTKITKFIRKSSAFVSFRYQSKLFQLHTVLTLQLPPLCILSVNSILGYCVALWIFLLVLDKWTTVKFEHCLPGWGPMEFFKGKFKKLRICLGVEDKNMEFFGVEATIFMKLFFRSIPIFFRGKTHIFKEVFKGECNLVIKSLEVRRQFKSSTGGGRGRGYGHRPSRTRDNNFVKWKGHFGRNDRKDQTGLQRYSQIFWSDQTETVRSIWFLTEISGILAGMEIAVLSKCFSL